MKTVVLDFDGVLHSYVRGWTGPVPLDPPVPGAVEFVMALLALDVELVVLTTRADSDEGRMATEDWLDEHDFPKMRVTNLKVPAMCYVDDRAVRYEKRGGFDAALDEVKEFLDRRRP